MTVDHSPNLSLLLSRVALADRSAFRQLYDATSPKLFGSLLRILKKPELAEDALQETFIKIWNNADSYREYSSKPMTWLHSIARYRAIDILRKQKHDVRNIPIEEETESTDAALSYMDNFAEGDHARLMHCLSQLERKHKEAIVKCYCEGYTHSELSRLMSTPLGTVKSWVRRGLQSLKQCLEK